MESNLLNSASNFLYHTHFYFNILSLAAKISARWLHCHKHGTCYSIVSSNSHWCVFFISRNQSIRRIFSFQKHDEKTTVFRDHCFQEFGPWFEWNLHHHATHWLATRLKWRSMLLIGLTHISVEKNQFWPSGKRSIVFETASSCTTGVVHDTCDGVDIGEPIVNSGMVYRIQHVYLWALCSHVKRMLLLCAVAANKLVKWKNLQEPVLVNY